MKNPATHNEAIVFAVHDLTKVVRSLLFPCRIVLIGFYTLSANAAPLLTSNQSPLVGIYGLPLPENALLPAVDTWRITGSLNLSNTVNIGSSTNEFFLLDGETHRFNTIIDHGWSQDWSFRLILPWIRFSAGFLDRSIDRYHQILGLHEGDRPSRPRDQILLFYQNKDAEALYIDSSRSGIGDIQFIINRQLHRSDRSAYSVSGGLKIPSGDSDKLTGSGATDVSFQTAGHWQLSDLLHASASAGLLFTGDNDILPLQQKKQIAFGHGGLQWKAFDNTVLKTQLDWHTRFYENTNIDFLGEDVLQLSFGGTVLVSRNIELDIAVTEDIKTDASPDVNFNFSLRVLYK